MITSCRKTVSFVPISDVLIHMGVTSESDQMDVFDFGFKNVSFGDAEHTLIGNNFALECILDSLDPEKYPPEVTSARFWEIVGLDDCVDMEN